MKLTPYLKCFAVAALAVSFLCAANSHAADGKTDKNYILATASTGGTYYPVGVAVSTLIKVKLQADKKIGMSAISSAGSGENIKLMRDNEAQFSILQGLYGYYAWSGQGPLAQDGPQKNLRSISMLWQNVEHFAVKLDFVRTGDMSDLVALRNKWFSMGQRNSGSEGSGVYILERLGFSPSSDFQIASIDYGSNASAIRNGSIDGMNIPGGPPVSAVAEAYKSLGKDLTVLNFTDEQLNAVNSGYPLWHRFIISPGTYPGQDREIATIAQPNFLAVRDDVDEEAVYLIVKTIYANLPFLHIIHSANEAMSLDKAIAGLPVPLHPGAARFYREQESTSPTT